MCQHRALIQVLQDLLIHIWIASRFDNHHLCDHALTLHDVTCPISVELEHPYAEIMNLIHARFSCAGVWFIWHHFWFLDIVMAGMHLQTVCMLVGGAMLPALLVPGLLAAGTPRGMIGVLMTAQVRASSCYCMSMVST